MKRPAPQDNRALLVGFDFGSTTSSALVASARIAANSATGRMELGSPSILFRPEPVLTPYYEQRLDLNRIEALVQGWLADAGLTKDQIFSASGIVTGLAARQDNARDLTARLEALVGEALVATADDPRLESWLAFMGSCGRLSRAHPDQAVLNLDIGGGTTNSALGREGAVLSTGSAFIGARHLRFEPGTYRLIGTSEFGRAILDAFGIHRSELTEADIARVTAFYVQGLEALAAGDIAFFASDLGGLHEQAAFTLPPLDGKPVITFSGGVGELIYAAASGKPWPSRTFYGDLGIDLAQAILQSSRLARDVRSVVPDALGRATVQGLTLDSTEISGTTLFLPSPQVLPLRDVPVVAEINATSTIEDITHALEFAAGSQRGACIVVRGFKSDPGREAVRTFGLQLAAALDATAGPDRPPLVLLTDVNAGKAIGNYATAWQNTHRHLIVIDEVAVRRAQFVNVGRPRHGVVPVSFYGLNPSEGENP